MSEMKWSDLRELLPPDAAEEMETALSSQGEDPDNYRVVLPPGVSPSDLTALLSDDDSTPREVITTVDVLENGLNINWRSIGHGFGMLEIRTLPGGVVDVRSYGMPEDLITDILVSAAPQLAKLIAQMDRTEEK